MSDIDSWIRSTEEAKKRLEEAPVEDDEPKSLAEALKQKAEADKKAAENNNQEYQQQRNAFADALEEYNRRANIGRK
jgi:hypothetical protein